MTVLLCISLAFFMGFIMLIRNKDVLSPTFLSTLVFFIAAVALAYRENIWGVDLNIAIILIMVGALLCMLLGELFCVTIFNRGLSKKSFRYKKTLTFYSINKTMIVIEMIVATIIAIVYWQYVKNLALVSGVGSGNILWDARVSMLSGNNAAGIMMNIAKTVVIMFSIFCIYIFINNKLFEKYLSIKTHTNYILFPILPSVLLIIFDTGRTEFIRLISIAFIGYIFFYRYYFNKFSIGRFIKKGLVCFVILIVVFWVVGSISNKNGSYSMINNVAKYIGSGIAGFNEMYNRGIENNEVWGGATFRGIRQTLAIFIPSIQTSDNILPFVMFADGEMTNIYTSLYEYYYDFGLLGAMFIYFLQGVFLTFLYKKAKDSEPGVWTLMYMFYSYAIFRQITAADFITTYFGTTHIIAFMTLLLSYKLCIKKKTYFIESGE